LSETLVTATPLTRRWLEIIKANVIREIPSAKYYERKHWASFKNPSINRRFAYLNPLAKEIRVFLKLPVLFDDRLEPAPSSGTWAENYPSIFKMRSENNAEKASNLIIASCNYDLKK
jgi:hypothetical protein